MGLGTFIQFTAGTKAVATQVNDNFDAITTWANGNVTSENLGVLNNTLQFSLNTNVNGITIANSGNVASLLITQSDNLANGEGVITIDDSTIDQTAVDAAEFRIKAKTASTIPAIWVTHAAVDTFKLTKDYLRLEAILKPPVKTTAQRNAIVSPEEGSVIYNSTTAQLNEKRNDGWAPVGSPVGSVQMFAGSAAPESWLLCDGSTLDSVANPKYAALFAVIGTTYGGTGAASFKVPDCRGIFVRGVGSQTIGAETHIGVLGTKQNDATAANGLSMNATGSHNHGGTTGNSTVPYQQFTNPSGGGPISTSFALNTVYTTNNSNNALSSGQIPNSSHSHSISSDGSHNHTFSSTDTETRPANIALNYIIKY